MDQITKCKLCGNKATIHCVIVGEGTISCGVLYKSIGCNTEKCKHNQIISINTRDINNVNMYIKQWNNINK